MLFRSIKAAQNGGIEETKVEDSRQENQVLDDEQIDKLATIGRRIESHFGYPQDIEWSLVNESFYILQTRPITTLYPLPNTGDALTPRVYMSIGHTQMMTDAMKPLGMSFFKMISEVKLDEIGGRMYSDITHDLSSTRGRSRLLIATGKQDPLIQGAIKNLIENKKFMESLPKGERNVKGGVFTAGSLLETIKVYRKNDPSIIEDLINDFESEISNLDQELSKLSANEALEYIVNDRDNLLAMAYNPKMLGAIIAAILVNDSLNRIRVNGGEGYIEILE